MKQYILSACFLLSFLTLSSQELYVDGNILRAYDQQSFRTRFNLDEAEIQGNPYLEKTFKTASLDKNTAKISARFNIFNDVIEFKQDDKIMVVPKSSEYSKIVFDNGPQIVLFNDQYFILLKEAKSVSLVKKMTIKFQDFQKAANGYVKDKAAKFIAEQDQYFLLKDSALIPFPKKEKEFAQIFPDRSGDILKYLSSKKNKLKTESDKKDALQFAAQN